MTTSSFEIEQKFVLTDGREIEARLRELGWQKDGEQVIVDWYFDLEEPVLTPGDSWLRYRETPRSSQWQLKSGKMHKGGATVYEEIEGEEAVRIAIGLVPEGSQEVTETIPKTFEGSDYPQLPIPCALQPFARIQATRSSWSSPRNGDAKLSGLSVDLDTTSYGYTVGEVETVVQGDSDIDAGREKVKGFLHELLPGSSSLDTPAVGKLEDYLMRYRPDHYEACIRGGSIKRR